MGCLLCVRCVLGVGMVLGWCWDGVWVVLGCLLCIGVMCVVEGCLLCAGVMLGWCWGCCVLG